MGLMGRLIRLLLRKSIFILRCHAMKPITTRTPTITDTPMVTFVVEDTWFAIVDLSRWWYVELSAVVAG